MSIGELIAMGLPTGGGTPSGGGGIVSFFVPLIFLLGIFYFLIILPQNKERRRHQELLDALKKGDKVVTNSGIYGVVHGINKDRNTIVLKVSEETKIEFSRGTVSRRQSDPAKEQENR